VTSIVTMIQSAVLNASLDKQQIITEVIFGHFAKQIRSAINKKVIKYSLTQFLNFLSKNLQGHVSALRSHLQAEHKTVCIY